MGNMISQPLGNNLSILETPVVFIKDHKVLSGVVAALGVYGLWYLYRPRNMPPGPWGYPIVGSSFSMGSVAAETMIEMANTYGDVMTMWNGGTRYAVVLSSLDVVKEAFIARGCMFNNRDIDLMGQKFGMEDEIFCSNYTDRYIAARKFALGAIRSSGIHDGTWDLKFGVEVDELATIFANSHGKPVDLEGLFRKATANITLQLLMGIRHSYDDKELQSFITSVEEWFMLLFSTLSASQARFPMSTYLMWKYSKGLRKKTAELIKFIEESIEEHSSTYDASHIRDIIDVYIKHGELDKVGAHRLASTILVMLPDGVHTTSSVMVWVFVFLIKFPEHQDRIRKEVDELKGGSGDHVKLSEKSKLPFTRAFINEVLRIVTPAVLNVVARPMENTTLRGYNIPKHVDVRVNYLAIHRDPKLFPDPEEFQPERFLSVENDSQVEGLCPFGIGRRSCIGEQIARNELVFFTANLVRKFHFELAAGETLPSMNSTYSKRTRFPTPFTAVVKDKSS